MDLLARLRSLAPVLVVLVAVLVAGCGDDASKDDSGDGSSGSAASSGASGSAPRIALRQVGAFTKPVVARPVPGTDLVAVVEQGGRVLVVTGMSCGSADACPQEPVDRGSVAIDIRDQVSSGNEQGLLGLAFHPDWPDDPRIFIDYTDRDGDTHVEAWDLRTPTARATRSNELLRIDQPFENHNGGDLEFGPDGLLYVGTGDGGSAGDPADRAQEADELLGKILRIDVDGGGERGYAIPDGNVEHGAPEVWAVGLRNPWRFSFDAKTGDLWIGDVGQDTWEEVDALPRTLLAPDAGTPNLGWRRREGFAAFDETGRTGPGERVEPALSYGRDEGCSVTGGVVYRGELVPDLDGWYVFADFCKEDLRLVDADGVPGGSHRRGELEWTSRAGVAQVSSFAQVQRGELLVLSLGGGIYQVVPA
jgi:glucose/arabinose dehydrogenase